MLAAAAPHYPWLAGHGCARLPVLTLELTV